MTVKQEFNSISLSSSSRSNSGNSRKIDIELPSILKPDTVSYSLPSNFTSKYKNRKPLFIKNYFQVTTPNSTPNSNLTSNSPSKSKSTLNSTPCKPCNRILPFSKLEDIQPYLTQPSSIQVMKSSKYFLDDDRFVTKSIISFQDLLNHFNLKNITTEEKENQKGDIEFEESRQLPEKKSNGMISNTMNESINHDSAKIYFRSFISIQLYESLYFSSLFHDHINELESSISSPDIDSNTSELNQSYQIPKIIPSLCQLWISSSHATTPLHYDKCHGLLIQLYGCKRFIIFHRDEVNGMYLYDNPIHGPTHASKLRGIGDALQELQNGSNNMNSHNIDIDIDIDLDLDIDMKSKNENSNVMNVNRYQQWLNLIQKYPKLKHCQPYYVLLEPGDAIYTPPGFFHEVTSMSTSVSVTIPWDMTPDEIKNVPSFMVL